MYASNMYDLGDDFREMHSSTVVFEPDQVLPVYRITF
jgi:hypothetical protein